MASDFCKVKIELIISSGTEEEIIESFRQRLSDGDFDDDGIEIQEIDK